MDEFVQEKNLEEYKGNISLIYIDPPFMTQKTQKLHNNSYEDKFESLEDYIDFLKNRIEKSIQYLTDNGSFFIHIDYRTVHYVKVMMDGIFGRKSFMNEIIWAYDYGGRAKKHWSRKHDNILWYVKNPKDYIFNYEEMDRIPYMAPGLVGPEKAARGKAQPISEPVLTPNGWTSIGEISIGDYVYGSEGKPIRVSGVFPQGKKDIYKITFTDGSWTRSTEEHLWTFSTQNGFTYTQPLYEWMKKPYKSSGEVKKHLMFLPITNPVEFEEKDLPLDPYTLGALLGDGGFTEKTITFTTMDEDILKRLKLPVGVFPKAKKHQNSGKATCYRLVKNINEERNELLHILKSLELHGHNSLGKFIPNIYKTGSIEQRIALLQGLLDTDGESLKSKTASFSSSSLQLIKDVQNLVWSLGGSGKICEKPTNYNMHYRLRIRMPDCFNLFLCERKIKKSHTWAKPYRAVESIEKEYSQEEAVCIRVESEDRLYITKDYILTHNTPTDVWWHTIVPTNGKERVGYPTQKPLGILERIIKVHTNPGDFVLDFFAGSGTTAVAAAKLGRNYVSVDKNPDAVEIINRRLSEFS